MQHAYEVNNSTLKQMMTTQIAPFIRRQFLYIFLNENGCILVHFSLKIVSNGGAKNNNPVLIRKMTSSWTGDKPLSEAMVV